MLEDEEVPADEIEAKVDALRTKLSKLSESSKPRDRGSIKSYVSCLSRYVQKPGQDANQQIDYMTTLSYETHEMAAIKQAENEKLAKAFGIDTATHKEGQAFDREAQAEIAAAEKAEREQQRAARQILMDKRRQEQEERVSQRKVPQAQR